MCGICGFTEATENDRPVLKAMCDVMAHRGPDGEGRYIADGIALGHRRLARIDMEGGKPPRVSPKAIDLHIVVTTRHATRAGVYIDVHDRGGASARSPYPPMNVFSIKIWI